MSVYRTIGPLVLIIFFRIIGNDLNSRTSVRVVFMAQRFFISEDIKFARQQTGEYL